MKKSIIVFLLSLFLFLTVPLYLPSSILADGMMIHHDPYSNRWDYSNESSQQAFINYQDGLQKMVISVDYQPQDNTNVVWLFPIPSAPEKIAIDVVGSLPRFRGEDISIKAKSNLDQTRDILQMSQIYTIPFVLMSKTQLLTPNLSKNVMFGSLDNIEISSRPDIVVYEHIEKEGIASEIVTAKTATGLYDYLKNKGLNVEIGSISVLGSYIGKDYSFIVSWISPSPVYNSKQSSQKGIFVTFPTKDIYFPMLPTSVYGSKIIPAVIRVIGHVSPQIYNDIKSYTKTEYYFNNVTNSIPEGLENFYQKSKQNDKYTKIEINAPSKFLTDDLWIKTRSPVKTFYSTFAAKYSKTHSLILLILSSVITSLLTGFILFKDLRKNPLKLGLVGLANCFSIIGVILTIALVGTKDKNDNIISLLSQIKQKGYFWKRKLASVLLLISSPYLLILPVQINILLNSFITPRTYLINLSQLIRFIIFNFISISIIVFSFVIKRVKVEDKDLFNQLKLVGYSSWSFQPIDKLKFAFPPLFSALFLLISWVLVASVKSIL